MKLFQDKKDGYKATRQIAFSIFDEKASAYNLPFCYSKTELAVRAFTDMLQNPQSIVSRHPADFSLYAIGTFDDNDGKLMAYDPPTFVVRGSDIMNQINKTTKPEEK